MLCGNRFYLWKYSERNRKQDEAFNFEKNTYQTRNGESVWDCATSPRNPKSYIRRDSVELHNSLSSVMRELYQSKLHPYQNKHVPTIHPVAFGLVTFCPRFSVRSTLSPATFCPVTPRTVENFSGDILSIITPLMCFLIDSWETMCIEWVKFNVTRIRIRWTGSMFSFFPPESQQPAWVCSSKCTNNWN